MNLRRLDLARLIHDSSNVEPSEYLSQVSSDLTNYLARNYYVLNSITLPRDGPMVFTFYQTPSAAIQYVEHNFPARTAGLISQKLWIVDINLTSTQSLDSLVSELSNEVARIVKHNTCI